jgi:hypothetical protein
MNMREAFATIRFCINILYSDANYELQRVLYGDSSNGSGSQENQSHGNFYTNDIKVLLEVCLRELVNIPVESSFDELRLRYGQFR